MSVLPPGNILQNLFIREQVKKNSWNSFLEVGSGNGYVSQLLLESGLTGVGCDLNKGACENNTKLNERFIKKGHYKVLHSNFLEQDEKRKFDLIISCMVIEHLNDEDRTVFIQKAKSLLNKDGSLVLLVPAGMKFWGVEDDIAGHIMRYEFEDFNVLSRDNDLVLRGVYGLTYPISNWLLRLSNFLVARREKNQLGKSQQERTIATGNRDVPFKTTFPNWMGLILNEVTMRPFHWLQLSNLNNRNALVIFAHLQLKS